jgi:recombination protein RecA
MTKASSLRLSVESALAGRVSAPFTYRDRQLVETVPSGIPQIDSLAGGLPRGSLTEICGPPCSGRTSILFSALASRTAQPEACALIDGRDAFDPHSAETAGVNLKNLLWVRCRNVDESLRAADLLLQGGGFGLIVLDLSDIPPETVRYVPLNAWFRFRKTVEDTPTILLLLEQESNAKTCASLVLGVRMDSAHWTVASEETVDPCAQPYPYACLFEGFESRAEVLRSRIEPVSKISLAPPHHSFSSCNPETVFESKTSWSFSGVDLPAALKPFVSEHGFFSDEARPAVPKKRQVTRGFNP